LAGNFQGHRIKSCTHAVSTLIVITFENGKVWEIDVQKSLGNKKDVGFEESLENIFKEYEDAIVNVDFRLDVQRVKADIQKRTQVFLKKRK